MLRLLIEGRSQVRQILKLANLERSLVSSMDEFLNCHFPHYTTPHTLSYGAKISVKPRNMDAIYIIVSGLYGAAGPVRLLGFRSCTGLKSRVLNQACMNNLSLLAL